MLSNLGLCSAWAMHILLFKQFTPKPGPSVSIQLNIYPLPNNVFFTDSPSESFIHERKLSCSKEGDLTGERSCVTKAVTHFRSSTKHVTSVRVNSLLYSTGLADWGGVGGVR